MTALDIALGRTAAQLARAGLRPLDAIRIAVVIARHGWREWTVDGDTVRVLDPDAWLVDDGVDTDVYRGETTAEAVAAAWVDAGHPRAVVLGRPLLRASGLRVEIEVASC